jgi:SEC-C motif domain protein
MICPCRSDKPYKECCQHYHDGFPPENALCLMRSRYSAYALQLADYIIKTTHPQNPLFNPNKEAWKRDILAFSQSTRFDGLTIVNFTDGERDAQVTFTVYLLSSGANISFTEKSLFKKEGPWWLYYTGEHL